MSTPPSTPDPRVEEPRIIGRYALYDEIAAGGMATVHIGRLIGPVGFSRTVAIKRLHPQFAKDPEFVAMFLDEARLAARIRHPNVVPTLDVVALDHELFLVMEYVQGESLARMVRASRKVDQAIPLNLVTTIMAGVLHGLHAAHEAKTEQGEPLFIVHRDVSPQNVLVGIDGVARVLDFGVAKAAYRAQTTREGQIKGKVAYMPPEQIRAEHVDRRCDVYAAAAVLWEAVTRRRLYQADSDAALLAMVLFEPPPSPRSIVPEVSPELERIIMRGLERDRDKRYATAREMAVDLENCLPVASASSLGGWVERLAGAALASRQRRITDIESTSSPAYTPLLVPPASDVRRPAAPPVEAPAPPSAGPASAPTSRAPADDGAEQASTVSKVGDGAPPVRPTRRGLALAAAAVLLVGVAVFVTRAVVRGPDADRAGGTTGDTARAAADSGAPQATSEPPATAGSPATAADDPAARASAAAAPQPKRSAAVPAPSARAGTAPARTGETPKPPARPAGNCTPPYTVDASGFRHMKPECL